MKFQNSDFVPMCIAKHGDMSWNIKTMASQILWFSLLSSWWEKITSVDIWKHVSILIEYSSASELLWSIYFTGENL